MKINGLDLMIKEGHFVANDLCRQNLDESPIQLPEDEDIVMEHNMLMIYGSGNPIPRIKNLLYFNDITIIHFFRTHSELPVICPICNKRYVIIKKDYDSLKESSK